MDRDIAIVGMANRVPGANNIGEFWENLVNGVDSISRFTDGELTAAGINPQEARQDDRRVWAKGVMKDADTFDAKFFGILPKEARVMDPQHRVFLELCWEVLERAGVDSNRFNGNIGVFAGAFFSTYLLTNLCKDPKFYAEFLEDIQIGDLKKEQCNEKDYFATRVAYKLNLKGASMTVGTACSTSLVAVCQACMSLREGINDMVLAGGIAITYPQERSYLYESGSVLSPDGHCRPFGSDAAGTIFSNGAGVVALKRLEDAERDGDLIHAVIKGFGLNNDGIEKQSFSAPSIEGQSTAVSRAHRDAGVSPETITYVEAHGTGTPLGDPIEFEGLSKAFRVGTDKKQFCAMGSVKSNVGHLDIASGVTGLIKTSLALHHRWLPPTLHYRRPNPRIDLSSSPFYIQAKGSLWDSSGGVRRAGVSSFGIGGTNAHVVLEEAPERAPSDPSERHVHLAVLSAQSADALENMVHQLRETCKNSPDLPLADLAFTLQNGRRQFSYRLSWAARSVPELAEMLGQERAPSKMRETIRLAPECHCERPVVFMFPGQGAQHSGMGKDLYATSPVFRYHADKCFDLYASLLGEDLQPIIFPSEENVAAAAEKLRQTSFAQPAIFIVSYAMARMWMELGVKPMAMIGHSLGELVAACLSGSVTLEDAMKIVCIRGRVIQEMPPGRMLSVALDEEEVAPFLSDDVSIAANNGPRKLVLSGTGAAIERVQKELESQGHSSRLLHTSHAFHSAMMEPCVQPFREMLSRIQFKRLRGKVVSTVTSEWMTDEQVTSPDYWAEHVRRPVQFGAALSRVMDEMPNGIFLEVGPGQNLMTFARQNSARSREHAVVASSPHPQNASEGEATLASAMGRLWEQGVPLDWKQLYPKEKRHRILLPTYAFERKRYWIDPPQKSQLNVSKAEQPKTLNQTQIVMPNQPTQQVSRKPRIRKAVQDLLEELSGMDAEDLEDQVSFLEIGFDSLQITQMSRELRNAFSVEVSMRDLMTELNSPGKLTDFLDTNLPADQYAEAEAPEVVAPPAAVAAVPMPAPVQVAVAESVSTNQTPIQQPVSAVVPQGDLSTFRQQQFQIMHAQIQLAQAQIQLMQGQGQPAIADAQSAPTVAMVSPVSAVSAPAVPELKRPEVPVKMNSKVSKEAFGPFQGTKSASMNGDLTPPQKAHLEGLVKRYCQKTAKSKARTQEFRQWFADPRTASGFNPSWKEMCYQIIVERSKGAYLWDIDGNQYIDMLNGFGPNFLGHSPNFVTEKLHEQLDAGVEVGPQHPLAGETAKMLCDFTGLERASFVSTGSEAVQAAIRVARTVTARDKVIIFEKDYHGNFDEVLVRGVGGSKGLRSMPVAPGIPKSSVSGVLVLPYGEPSSLEYIMRHGDEIAAVIVEPVQSRHPEMQPKEFVRELRAITEASGTIFVFDEVITGFRSGPGGAQAFYDVRADLACYGKVIGGGMPIGVVAGRADLMDTFDGGMWQYGDASFPSAGVTFFAGTFVRHPLAIAACHAMLTHLKSKDETFWNVLNGKMTHLASHIDTLFRENGVPIEVPHFSTLMFLRVPPSEPHANLLFYHLRERGVFLLETFPSYLTAAHTDDDIQKVIDAFKGSVEEMQQGGFFRPIEKLYNSLSNGSKKNGSRRFLAGS